MLHRTITEVTCSIRRNYICKGYLAIKHRLMVALQRNSHADINCFEKDIKNLAEMRGFAKDRSW